MIREAANTWNPSLLTLQAKGYKIWMEIEAETDIKDWIAQKDGHQFSATDPNALLGLVTMFEFRGENWQKKPEEVDLYDQLSSDVSEKGAE